MSVEIAKRSLLNVFVRVLCLNVEACYDIRTISPMAQLRAKGKRNVFIQEAVTKSEYYLLSDNRTVLVYGVGGIMKTRTHTCVRFRVANNLLVSTCSSRIAPSRMGQDAESEEAQEHANSSSLAVYA